MWRLSSSRMLHRRYRKPIPNESFGTLLPWNYPTIDHEWTGRTRLEARCEAVDEHQQRLTHQPPDAKCRCGIYGFKQIEWVDEALLELLSKKLADYSKHTRRGPTVGAPQECWIAVGSVMLWGKVIEGTWGYRAQHAYPEALWLLPPARIGGADKHAISEETVALAHDLLVAMRSRYRVPVGYADYDDAVNDLIRRDETGWFFTWRLSSAGRDRLAHALGETGQPGIGLPTVGDALDLWLESRPDDHRTLNEKHLVRRCLIPAFGHIPIDRSDQIDQITYEPRSPVSGNPYHPGTINRHLNILKGSIEAETHAMAHNLDQCTASVNPRGNMRRVGDARRVELAVALRYRKLENGREIRGTYECGMEQV